MKLVIATANLGKVEEVRALLGQSSVELLSLRELPPVEFPAEGDDYRSNAIEKARAAASQLGLAAVADDSGLEVDALDGRPGVRSARYGGPGLDDRGRVALLLKELRGVAAGRRTARFVCHAALALPDPDPGDNSKGEVACVEGLCAGVIRVEPSGAAGFGYDPVFQAAGEALTMAELSAERKNAISHRARAFAALVQTSSWASLLST